MWSGAAIKTCGLGFICVIIKFRQESGREVDAKYVSTSATHQILDTET